MGLNTVYRNRRRSGHDWVMDLHREIAERVGADLAGRDDVLAVLIAGSASPKPNAKAGPAKSKASNQPRRGKGRQRAGS
jgi:hypothetical protein